MESWLTEKLLTSDLVHPDQGRAEIVAFVQECLAELPWEKAAEEADHLADPSGGGV